MLREYTPPPAPTEYLYYSTIIQEYAAWKLYKEDIVFFGVTVPTRNIRDRMELITGFTAVIVPYQRAQVGRGHP